jgi:hypothetical protein
MSILQQKRRGLHDHDVVCAAPLVFLGKQKAPWHVSTALAT